ncbi:MAG: glutathione S-transferase family protein [Rhodospirillales bacterium]
MPRFTLVSHHLCPYVQRAAIALLEKGVAFDRQYIDLSDKPDWFLEISPLGKTPLLIVDLPERSREVLFESAAILEYLEDVAVPSLHPADPLTRARHRGWIEVGSTALTAIAGYYSAPDETALTAKAVQIQNLTQRMEAALNPDGPWFAGDQFTLVDVVWAPVFRYFDAFDRINRQPLLPAGTRLAAWRARLAGRSSVRNAVDDRFADRLMTFLRNRDSALSHMMESGAGLSPAG